MDKAPTLERLRALPILHSLSDDVLEKFAHIAHEEAYEPDQVLYEEGAEGDSMCFILEGSVVIQKVIDTEEADRRYKDVAISEQGDIIGEMALFDRKPRSATVRARGPLKVLTIYRRDFEKFLQEDSGSASSILGGLLSMQNARLRGALQQNVTMFELVNIIASVQEVRELARQVMERLMASLRHVDAGAFCHWNPYIEDCEVLHAEGVAPGEEAILSISRSGPMASVLREQQEPLVLSGLAEDHPVRRLFHVADEDAVLVTPLKHGQDLLGYIILVGRGMTFTSAHRLMVAAVAAPVASAIVNVRYAEDEQARGRLQTARAQGNHMSTSRSRPT